MSSEILAIFCKNVFFMFTYIRGGKHSVHAIIWFGSAKAAKLQLDQI